jgi:hypothetical protein
MSPLELIGILAAFVAVLGFANHRFIGWPDAIGLTAAGSPRELLVMATYSVVLFSLQAVKPRHIWQDHTKASGL